MAIHQEIALYWNSIQESVGGIIASMDGLSGADLNWKPTPDSNSLYVLATHTMGNVEHTLLRILYGGPGERDRPAEFMASGDSPAPLQAFWHDLQARIEPALAALPADVLVGKYEFGRLGMISGRELLFRVARHAAEHLGHAELTRDLLLAGRADT